MEGRAAPDHGPDPEDLDVKTIILAGGRGTRLAEQTDVRPKPMVEIGGRPILWHLMRLYARHGFDEFVVALGYKAEVIKDFFVHYRNLAADLTVDLRTGETTVGEESGDDWLVHLVDTGLTTETGGRVKRLARHIGGERFLMTYGDGLASVDLTELVAFHERHGRLATVTAVRPPARFGGLTFDGDVVTRFIEKPQLAEGWISGGFFVLEPEVLDYIDDDLTLFEHEPLSGLAEDGQLMAYRHEGFWHAADTLRDLRLLNALWDEGDAPWLQ